MHKFSANNTIRDKMFTRPGSLGGAVLYGFGDETVDHLVPAKRRENPRMIAVFWGHNPSTTDNDGIPQQKLVDLYGELDRELYMRDKPRSLELVRIGKEILNICRTVNKNNTVEGGSWDWYVIE